VTADSAPKLCGAQLRGKPGQFCRSAPMQNGRCRLHGGASATGVRNGMYRTGKYSRSLPRHLRASYQQIASSPDLLSLTDDIALLQVRCNELAGRLTTGETDRRWAAVRAAWDGLTTAAKARDEAGMRAAVLTLTGLLAPGPAEPAEDDATWEQLTQAMERKAALQAREVKMLEVMEATATAEQVRSLIRAVAESVLRHVPEDSARRAIVGDILRLGVFDPEVAPLIPEPEPGEMFQPAPEAGTTL
jgi:hypothetical protein